MEWPRGAVLLVAIAFVFLGQCDGANILGVFAFPGPSQYIYGSSLLKALAERGHQITSITVFPQKKPLKNFRDIYIPESVNLYNDLLNQSLSDESFSFFDDEVYKITREVCINVLENKEVQEMLKSPSVKFDLVILETFLDEALYGFGQHFNAPLIGVSTLGTMSSIDILVGNTSPLSYVPHWTLPFESEMSFKQRLTNLAVNLLDYGVYNFIQLPKQETLYRKYFPKATMNFYDVVKNFSLILVNDHFSLSFPRPYITNVIEVGGMHIKQQPDPLPHELQDFLDDAPEGVIYFSMGSNLKSKDFPPEKIQIFLNVFRSLKHKVMWKFEDPELPNKPENVFISPWYPQPSVLAHPNVKVFISHGGLLGTMESIFHAKPIMGIPMFFDQEMNVANAVKRGIALHVEFKNLNEKELKEKLLDLLNNSTYTRKVQELSQLFVDKPHPPMETAIYWVEYVLRHKGAPHLRNAGQNLNFWQYHSVDTIFTLFGGISVILTVMFLIIAKSVKGILKLIGDAVPSDVKIKKN